MPRPGALAHTVATSALIVVVLGILPFAWDAPATWKVLGPVVAAVFASRAAGQVWQQVFSTSPRHLGC